MGAAALIEHLLSELRGNDDTIGDQGLRTVWDYTGDVTRFIFRNNMTDFIEVRRAPLDADDPMNPTQPHQILRHNTTRAGARALQSAKETRAQFPTSFYAMAMDSAASAWDSEGPPIRVGGESGWIATQVMRVVSRDGRMRRWIWELRKHRRPPKMGQWYVESVGSSDRNGSFEPDGDPSALGDTQPD